MQVDNILVDTDSYKVSMWKQYPPGSEYVYSYVASRGGIHKELQMSGNQMLPVDLAAFRATEKDVMFAEKFWNSHGEPFNTEGWMHIVEKHDGALPLEIRTIDDGLIVPNGTPQMTVVNTDPLVPWLTTWVETPGLRVWYPTTVATRSWNIKQVIKAYLEESGDVGGLTFKLHDFGSRGASSVMSASIGGMGHLQNFHGTDTAVAILAANKYYGADLFSTAFSIPAAEHSTITSWGRGREALAYQNMVYQFSKEGSIYAVVSDSYDIYNAVDKIWGQELVDLVRQKKGTLVIRPDSGDPVTVIGLLLKILENRFGVDVNIKGYKVLRNVRLIWGDGINELAVRSILRLVVDMMGFSADNIAFGMGGALLQITNRDENKYAMKASAICINGQWVDVFKDPITDPGKASLKGRFSVIEHLGMIRPVAYDESYGDRDMLKLRYRNGETFNLLDHNQVRANAGF